MARLGQNGAASGARKVPAAPHALWERAGARTGRGADALFDRLDAQNAQDAQEAQATAATSAAAREQAALALEALAARIRAGAWGEEIAAAVATARAALDGAR
jgi:predicted kinase